MIDDDMLGRALREAATTVAPPPGLAGRARAEGIRRRRSQRAATIAGTAALTVAAVVVAAQLQPGGDSALPAVTPTPLPTVSTEPNPTPEVTPEPTPDVTPAPIRSEWLASLPSSSEAPQLWQPFFVTDPITLGDATFDLPDEAFVQPVTVMRNGRLLARDFGTDYTGGYGPVRILIVAPNGSFVTIHQAQGDAVASAGVAYDPVSRTIAVAEQRFVPGTGDEFEESTVRLFSERGEPTATLHDPRRIAIEGWSSDGLIVGAAPSNGQGNADVEIWPGADPDRAISVPGATWAVGGGAGTSALIVMRYEGCFVVAPPTEPDGVAIGCGIDALSPDGKYVVEHDGDVTSTQDGALVVDFLPGLSGAALTTWQDDDRVLFQGERSRWAAWRVLCTVSTGACVRLSDERAP